MSKKIILTAILMLATTTVLATPFDGFYAGADVGMSQAQFDKNQMVTLSATVGSTPIFEIPITNKKELSDNSFNGNIDIGFSKVFSQHFYLGLEANADFQNLQASNNPGLTEAVSSFQITSPTTVNLRNEFALTLNPGFVFNKNTLLYGKIGPAWGRFSVDGSAQYNQNLGGLTASAVSSFEDDNFYDCGLRLGVGVEHYLTANLSLKLEYVNTNYGNIHSGSPATGIITTVPAGSGLEGTLSDSDKVSARNNSILLGLNYRFG
ncbi:MAG: outer membrane protein [Gammaproteobacteria bacterium]